MTVSDELKTRIRETAGDRCGYCLSAQKYVLGPLEIDHIIPQAAGGSDEEENLWLLNISRGTKLVLISSDSPPAVERR